MGSSNITVETLPQFTDQDIVTVSFRQNTSPLNSKPVIVLSAYLPINDTSLPSPTLIKLVNFCNQNKYSHILGCDSNAHNTVWGSCDTNRRGEVPFDFLLSNDLEVANTGTEPTFVSSRSQSFIDLTITTPYVLQSIKYWEVSDQETLSDHKLIKFQYHLSQKFTLPSFQNPKKLKADVFIAQLSKASSQLESLSTEFEIVPNITTCHIDSTTDSLSSIINSTFNLACPVSKPKRAQCNSWWNKNLRQQKRSAPQRPKRSSAPDN